MNTERTEKFVNAIACDLEEGGFRQVSGTTLRRTLATAVSAALPLLADTGIPASQPAALAEQQGVVEALQLADQWRHVFDGDGGHDAAGANKNTLRRFIQAIDALAATGKQQVGEAMDREQLGDLVEGMAVSVDVDGLFSTDGRRLFGTITAVQHEDGEKGGLMLLVQEPEPNWKPEQAGEVQGDARAQFEAWAKGEGWKDDQLTRYSGGRCTTAGEYHNSHLEALWYGWKSALAARQPGAQVPYGSEFAVSSTMEDAEAASDGMLPAALVPVADEWYRLCERRFAVDRIRISGKLAEAIVEAVCAAPPAQGIDLRQLRKLADRWERTANDKDVAFKDRELIGMYDKALMKCVRELRAALIDQRDAAPGVQP